MQKDDIVTKASSLILKMKAQRTQLKNFTVMPDEVTPQEIIRGQTGSKSDAIHLVITEVQEWIEELYDVITGLFTKKTVWELERGREEFMRLEVNVEEGRVANERTIEKMIETGARGNNCPLSMPRQNFLANMTLEVNSDMTFLTNCMTIPVVFFLFLECKYPLLTLYLSVHVYCRCYRRRYVH